MLMIAEFILNVFMKRNDAAVLFSFKYKKGLRRILFIT